MTSIYFLVRLSQLNITESRPLKNVARENANKLEKRKRACVTSRRPVNPTVNHVIPVYAVFESIVSCADNQNVALFIEEE